MGILPVNVEVGGVPDQEVDLVEIEGEGHDRVVGAAEGVDQNLLVHGQDQSLRFDHNLNLEGEVPLHLEDLIVIQDDLGV